MSVKPTETKAEAKAEPRHEPKPAAAPEVHNPPYVPPHGGADAPPPVPPEEKPDPEVKAYLDSFHEAKDPREPKDGKPTEGDLNPPSVVERR